MARRPTSNTIDVEAALELWHEHRNWAAVAQALPARRDGSHFTASAVYAAVYRADRLPEDGRRRRPTGTERDRNDRHLGVLWRPLLPRALKRIPCYRTDTVSAA